MSGQRKEGEKIRRQEDEGGVVIQSLSVSADSASPRRPHTEITANCGAIRNDALLLPGSLHTPHYASVSSFSKGEHCNMHTCK